MNLSRYFESIVQQDPMPIVICNTRHEIIYMNPTAVRRYEKRGGAALIGKSVLDCHNAASVQKICDVVAAFAARTCDDIVFIYHNPKENHDVYMVALRDEKGALIGYYEKHEQR